MHVVGFLNSKGGVGKSTLCGAVAVRAAQDSRRVCIVDLDPQESVADWWKRRGSPENPTLFTGAERASDAIEALTLDGWDWVFLDGPPGSLLVSEDAIKVSNLVVIPLRAAAFDLMSSIDTVEACVEFGVPYFCAFNMASPRGKDRLLDAARSTLFSRKLAVADTVIAQRVPFAQAISVGKTGAERDPAAAAEIDALWAEIKSAVLKPAKTKKRGA